LAITEADATGRFVDARGTRIHYGVVGSGEPVVLLHGGGPGANGWSNFRSNLDALASHFTLYVLDLPQFGRSDKPYVASNRLDFWSDRLAGFLDAVQVRRAHFIGNSMGGQAAIKVAIDRPDMVQTLTVLGPGPVRGSLYEPMPAEAIRMIGDYYEGGGPSREKMERLLRSLVYDQSFVTDEVIGERYRASIESDVLELHKSPEPAKQTLDEELHNVTCPALIVWGKDDRAAPLDVAFQLLKEFKRGEIHVYGSCGHWAQVEHSASFNTLVTGFMKRHAIGSEG
jgi:4,5:9,10-diseco-3-hydroxy-5,9,17-trioxoandrosta-1(10),2-diene-4-oate hydrolase